MGVLNSLFSGIASHGIDFPAQKASESMVMEASSRTFPSLNSAFSGFKQAEQPGDFASFLQTYAGVPWIYSTDYLLSSSIASRPLEIYRQLKDGKTEDITEGEVRDLFDIPNPLESFTTLTELTVLCLELTGNAYWEKGTLVGGLPIALWNLEPNYMYIIPDPKRKVGGYRYDRGDGTSVVIYKQEDIVHFKYTNPTNPFYGISQTRPLQNSIITELNRDTYTKAYLENEARPDVILTHHADVQSGIRPLTQADRDVIALKWRESFGGPRRTRTPVVMHSGMDVKLLTETTPDMAYQNLEKTLRERVLGASGVMPSLVSLFEYANYANTKEQLKIFHTVTLPPKFNLMSETITRTILRPFDATLRCRYNTKDIPALEEDKKEKTERVIMEFSNGLIKRSEARQALGYEDDVEDENADEYMVSSQLVPVKDVFTPPPSEEPIIEEPVIEPEEIDEESEKGGRGSGNYGHGGRSGSRGGSGRGGGSGGGGGGGVRESESDVGTAGRVKVKADSGVDDSIRTSVERDLERVFKENPNIAKVFDEIPLKGGINLSSKESLSSPGVKVPKGQYIIGAYTQNNRKIAVATKRIRTEPDDITLGKFNAISGVNGYVRHEVGHHVYLRANRGDFARAYSSTYGIDKKVSKYAGTSLEEGFTESFAVFTSPKYGKSGGKKLPPPIEKYMKNLLRG